MVGGGGTEPLHRALTVEIVLTVLLGLFSLTFGVLSFKISREFGWMIYKKIGADQAVKRKKHLGRRRKRDSELILSTCRNVYHLSILCSLPQD
jgi:hypothetical protein